MHASVQFNCFSFEWSPVIKFLEWCCTGIWLNYQILGTWSTEPQNWALMVFLQGPVALSNFSYKLPRNFINISWKKDCPVFLEWHPQKWICTFNVFVTTDVMRSNSQQEILHLATLHATYVSIALCIACCTCSFKPIHLNECVSRLWRIMLIRFIISLPIYSRHLYLIFRYLNVPWHGSPPNTLLFTSNSQLFLPLHFPCTFWREFGERQFVLLMDLSKHVCWSSLP